MYTLVGDDDDSDGLPTRVEIRGTGHDIDVYPSGPVSGRDDEGNGEPADEKSVDEKPADETRSGNDGPSSDSDDNAESNATEEESRN